MGTHIPVLGYGCAAEAVRDLRSKGRSPIETAKMTGLTLRYVREVWRRERSHRDVPARVKVHYTAEEIRQIRAEAERRGLDPRSFERLIVKDVLRDEGQGNLISAVLDEGVA